MKNFLNENFKYIILTFVIILIGLIIYDMTKVDNGMSKEDKKQIEQLNKDIDNMINYQKKLDEKITKYNEDIHKIDSTISNIKIKKEVVNNYYQQKGNEIKNSNPKQIDSLLRLRYNF
jgi:septal ring factor EnvC (AmiA/AmiB activator)